jgi:two-component system, LytTR family, response regulator
VERKSITVAVTGPDGSADKEIVAFLEADPDCLIVDWEKAVPHNGSPEREPKPDLIIIDTGQKPGSSLRRILGDLRALDSIVLVIAPDDRFALEAYQLRVGGYVTRPVVPETFSRALDWAKAQARQKSVAGTAEKRRGMAERLMVKSRNHIHLIKIENIDWIEANAGYYWLHTQGRKYLLRGKMKGLEDSLPDSQFVRIHRSLIVNIDRIQELQHISHGEYHAILDDGTKLAVSRNYRGKLFSAFVNAT